MVIVYKMIRKFNFLYTASNAIIILDSGTSLFFHKDLVINKNFRIQAGYSKDFFFPLLANKYLICSFIGPKLLRMNFRVAPNKLQNFFSIPVNLSKQIWKSTSQKDYRRGKLDCISTTLFIVKKLFNSIKIKNLMFKQPL